MEGEIHQQLGHHEASISALKDDVREIKADVKMVLETLAQTKGGVRTLLGVATLGGALGALLSKLIPFIRVP